MSNEAFEKWAIDYGLDYEPSFTRDDVEAAWKAAKADSEQSEHLPPIEYDQNMDRWYIPMIGGWEIQTKGNGSTFRICNTKTNKRWPVLDKHLHDALEQMAKDNRYAYPPRQLKRLSGKAIGDCLNKAELPTIMLNPIVVEKLDNFANAIMDEMERINK